MSLVENTSACKGSNRDKEQTQATNRQTGTHLLSTHAEDTLSHTHTVQSEGEQKPETPRHGEIKIIQRREA